MAENFSWQAGGNLYLLRMSNPIPTNKPGSREFEDTMHVFETTVAKGAKREAREFWKLGAYYTDGKTNELFKGFLHGMAYARNIINLEA